MTRADAAAWVQGIGTVLAVVVTGITIVWQARQTEADRQRRDQAHRLEQARLVQGWLTSKALQVERGLHDEIPHFDVRATVKNFSSAVAHDVRAYLISRGSPPEPQSVLRTRDSLEPMGEFLAVWTLPPNSPLAKSGDFDLAIDYTLNGSQWHNQAGAVQHTDAPAASLWERDISQVWEELTDHSIASAARSPVNLNERLLTAFRRGIFATLNTKAEVADESCKDIIRRSCIRQAKQLRTS